MSDRPDNWLQDIIGNAAFNALKDEFFAPGPCGASARGEHCQINGADVLATPRDSAPPTGSEAPESLCVSAEPCG